jgi:tetratricopeptide (TPR) repeat protein
MITELTRATLAGRRFLFGNVGEHPWTDRLVLAEDGAISGYQHPNETTWEILGDNLVFRSASGDITNEFRLMTLDRGRVSFRGGGPGGTDPVRHLTEYNPVASVPASVAIEHPLSERRGHDLAVLIRSYKCDAKYHDLQEKLERNRSGFDLFSIIDETHGRPNVPDTNVVWHSVTACRELGLTQDHPALLYHGSDFPFYFALRELPNYQHYLLVEDDVDTVSGDARFLNELAGILRDQPEIDFVGLRYAKLGPPSKIRAVCAKVFPDRDLYYTFFPFVVLSRRAAAYLFSQRLLEATRQAPPEDFMSCECFVASALMAGGFNCIDLNVLRPGSYEFSSMAMQIGDNTVGRPMGYDISPELTAPVEIVHPFYTAEEYADRAFRRFIIDGRNNQAGLEAELSKPWAAFVPRRLKDQLHAGRRPRQMQSRNRRVVFVGNCQARRLQEFYRDHLASFSEDTTECVVSYEPLSKRVQEILKSADVIVAQAVDSEMPVDVSKIDVSANVIWYPNVTGVFLWPYSSEAHIRNQSLPWFHDGPYGDQFGDRWLNRAIAANLPPEDVVDQYLELDIAKKINLDRLFELHIDRAHQRDARTDFALTPIIERCFREERLFLTPANLDLPLFIPLARGVYEQLGAPAREVDRVLDSLWRSVFPALDLPVHPSVARHFGLKFITPETRYRVPGGERISFTEWVSRYVRYQWNDDLLQGLHAAWKVHEAGADADTALALLRRGLDGTSGSAVAYDCIARLLLLNGDEAGAFEAVRQAAAAEPDSPGYRANVAHFLARKGALEDAESHIAPVTRQWPNYVDGWVRLARIRGQRGDGPGAMQAITRAAALAPRNPDVVFQQIFLAEKYADADEQLRIYRQAAGLAAKHARLARQLADQWSRIRHFPEAAEMYRAAIEIDGDDPELFARLAQALSGSGDVEGETAALQRAIELKPDTPRQYEHVAHVLIERGQLTEADAVLTNAVRLAPPDPGVLHLRALLFIHLQRPDAALEAAEAAAALAPDDPHIAARRAFILMELGDYAAAERILVETIAAHPDLTSLHGVLGELLLRQQRRDEARRAFNEALRGEPNHEGYQTRLKQLVEA